MTTAEEYTERPSLTRRSPSPTGIPTVAVGAPKEIIRSVSTASEGSVSGRSSTRSRASMESSVGSSVSRSSSASYGNRVSMAGPDKPKRRGYVRPQGTNFAKSAQSRESVLSLGSIAHLQYYFARTGLLDGKGGRLMKKRKDGRETLDLSILDTSFLMPGSGSDADSSYASTAASSPTFSAQLGGGIVESPVQDYDEYPEDGFESEEEDNNPYHMLPPTASTYIHREKVIAPPPTLDQLKRNLVEALNNATATLEDAKHARTPPASPLPKIKVAPTDPATPEAKEKGWFEIQGMHILDIITLAIRAAKIYYTAHERPDRLLAIKSEREIRAELLSVLEVLKRMATRGFAKGIRTEERETIENWVDGVRHMLRQEKVLEEEERRQQASWTWLHADNWKGKEIEREYAFMKSMDPDPDTLPPLSLVDEIKDDSLLPTPFLAEMRTGLRLVKLHNAAVKTSKRHFGAISTFHTEFGKPYRSAENLRFWVKAAELRWETDVKFDVMGVVNGEDRDAWEGFEEVIWKWCRTVREEISEELKRPRKMSIKV